MPSVLITGSNRGLGLEWVRQYAVQQWRVYATCRHPEQADELHALAAQRPQVSVHRLDVTDAAQIAALAAGLAGAPLDVLVNNAGVYFERWGRDPLGRIDYARWRESFDVNTLGAMRMSEALVEPLARGGQRLVITATSHMGSIAEIPQGRDYAYRSSKAALNAAMKGLAYELGERGIGVLLVHPGWVRTRMGGGQGRLTPQQSVADMRRLAERFEPSMSAVFYRHDGSIIPW